MAESFKIPILIGSTACGKTDLAMKLGEQITGAQKIHIISCDSLLIYKELNIGTAKPSQEELNATPHHLINLISPEETFTAADFVKNARPLIDDFIQNKTPFLITGGTGFYLKALLFGIWDAPPTQIAFRKTLEDETAHLEEAEKNIFLHEKLKKLDPEYAEKVKANDHYRVIRALEIISITQEPVSKLLEKKPLINPLPYPYEIYGIRRSKPELERRIVERTHKMFTQGLVNEVKALLEKYPKTLKALHSVGYKEVIDFLEGKTSIQECKELIVIATRQLAKKQMTFFKGMPGIQWFDLPQEDELLMKNMTSLLVSLAKKV